MKLEITYKYTKLTKHSRSQQMLVLSSLLLSYSHIIMSDQIKYPLAVFSLNISYKA